MDIQLKEAQKKIAKLALQNQAMREALVDIANSIDLSRSMCASIANDALNQPNIAAELTKAKEL